MPDDSSEPKPAIDLSDLRLVPQWVAEFGSARTAPPSYDEGDDRRDRGARGRDQRGGPRGFGGNDRGDRRGPPRGGRPGPQREGERRGGGRDFPGGDRRRDHGNFRRDDERPHGPRPEAPPLQRGLITAIEPDPRAIEAMSQMIRTAGKAYSVFEAARLVLASGERFHAVFSREGDAPGKFVVIPADGSVWITRDEAMTHLLQSDVPAQFYRREEIELEEPKGNFTSIAICGMSGEMIGPPSHHSYQPALHKLHRERFWNMPFEDFKRRVRTEATPEAVAKWKESQKHGVQWVYLKADLPEGGEAPRFKSRTEMEAHFRTHHADSLIGEAARITVPGNIPKKNLSPALYNALRRAVDDARKHLLATAQLLCAGFEKQGLKLFKRRGGKLWVSRIRPRLLDSSVVLSDRIAKMVEIIKAKPGLTVKELIETVAPGEPPSSQTAPAETKPAQVGRQPSADIAQSESQPPAKATTEAVAEPATVSAEPAAASEPSTTEPAQAETPAPVEAAIEAAIKAPAAPEPQPTPLARARMQALNDLHWLNSEGYVTEYSDGVVFPGVTEPPPAKPKAVKEPAAERKTEEPAAETAAETETETEIAVAEAPVESAPVETESPGAHVSAEEETSTSTPEIEAAK